MSGRSHQMQSYRQMAAKLASSLRPPVDRQQLEISQHSSSLRLSYTHNSESSFDNQLDKLMKQARDEESDDQLRHQTLVRRLNALVEENAGILTETLRNINAQIQAISMIEIKLNGFIAQCRRMEMDICDFERMQKSLNETSNFEMDMSLDD